MWDAGTEMEDPATEVTKDGNDDDDPADPDATVRVVPGATAMFKVTVTVDEL